MQKNTTIFSFRQGFISLSLIVLLLMVGVLIMTSFELNRLKNVLPRSKANEIANCTISLSATTVSPGQTVSIITYPPFGQSLIYVSRTDTTEILGLGPAVYTDSAGHHYYPLLTNKLSNLNLGTYKIWCNVGNSNDQNKCSGNPFCKDGSITVGCTGWASCSNSDNTTLTVTNQPIQNLPFWSYDTHPNYWPAEDVYTGKEYIRINETPNPGYNMVWVWSEPYNQNQRAVIYQKYPNDQPGSYSEWELWKGDPNNHSAYNYQYGGVNPQTSTKAYASLTSCQNEVNGYLWPKLENTETLQTQPTAISKNGICYRAGYVSVYKAEDWSTPISNLRNSKCDIYIPQSGNSSANKICKTAPVVGLIYQRYVTGNPVTESSPSYLHGCEATVYAWGYPVSSSNHFQNWFRNGELRWSEWLGITNSPTVHDPNDTNWWDTQCQQAFSRVSNWIYSGIYKPNGHQEFTDIGN